MVFKIFKQRDLFTRLTVKDEKDILVNRALIALFALFAWRVILVEKFIKKNFSLDGISTRLTRRGRSLLPQPLGSG